MNQTNAVEKVLIKDINAFCERHDIAFATFGRLAMKNPNFYRDLLEGRSPRGKTERKIRAWMKNQNIKLRGKKNAS